MMTLEFQESALREKGSTTGSNVPYTNYRNFTLIKLYQTKVVIEVTLLLNVVKYSQSQNAINAML